MANRMGTGYKGSSALQTSVAGQEIVHTLPYNIKSFYKFSFVADEDCTIIVNGEEIFIRAGYLWEINEIDKEIYSFKVKEAGKHFTWVGAF